MPKHSSNKGLDADFREENSKKQLTLALNQANEAFTESLAERRALDSKIYGLIALATALIVLVVSLKPQSFSNYVTVAFVAATLVLYFTVICLGLKRYSPTDLAAFDSRAISESLGQSFENLEKWTADCLLDYTDENYDVIERKARTLGKMLWIFLFATILFVGSALLYQR
jgi:CBS domain containing-hemolysin-like protein